MPNLAVIILKALFLFALVALLVQWGQQTATVEVTVIADGTMSRRAVGADDPAYRDEVTDAQNRALWFYGGALLVGFLGLAYVMQFFRVIDKRRNATRLYS